MINKLSKKLDPTVPFGFNVIGFVSGNLGQGVAARNTIKILIENNYKVSTIDIDAGAGRSKHDLTYSHLQPSPGNEIPYAINLFHVNPFELENILKSHGSFFKTDNRLNICIPFWEISELPVKWELILESMDMLLAPTHFVEQVLMTSLSNTPVIHYPQTIFLAENITPDRDRFHLPTSEFLFINSYEMASDINRKNPWAAIKAFKLACEGINDVRLVIKLNNANASPLFAENIAQLNTESEKDSRIIIINEVLSYQDVLSLYASCDCLVSLHRGEGLGLSFIEAMMLKKPVIGTGYSGNMDFMNQINSCLIPYRLIPVSTVDFSPYSKQQIGRDTFWADPNVADTAMWMRRLVDNKSLREQIGKNAQTSILQQQQECLKGETFQKIQFHFEHRLFIEQDCADFPFIGYGGLNNFRVLFVNRPTAYSHPGGDTMVMNHLQRNLEKSGIHIEFNSDPNGDYSSYDLVHIFNFAVPQTTEPAAMNCVNRNVPFVVTTLQEDFPKYFSKAKRTVELMQQYISSCQTQKEILELLPNEINRQKPADLLSSPFAAKSAYMLLTSGSEESRFLNSLYPTAKTAITNFGSSVHEIDVGPELFVEKFGVEDFVLCVGRLELRKNQLMLLAAFENEDIPLVFADGGFTYAPGYSNLCKQFKRRGKTVFTGRLSDEMLVSAYKAAHVHCVPSWYELPGLVSLEAALYGCNVVAGAWCTLHDYLGDTCGYCEPWNLSDIRNIVLDALNKPKTGAAGINAQNYTWENTGKQVLGFYKQAIENFNPKSSSGVSYTGPVNTLTLTDFMSKVTNLVETSQNSKAIEFYDAHRKTFPNDPSFQRFDLLMNQLRARGTV